jgi:nucleoside-diphosphate-sugar epimerase
LEHKEKHLFCFGFGYCCEYLTDILQKDGWRISGTTRDPEKRKDLRSRGIQAHLFDVDVPLLDPLYIMRDVTHILISTPPSEAGDPTFRMHAHDIEQLQNLEWVGYLSTTGSYGDQGGEWVDESTPARPTTKRGSRRLKSEEQWLSLHHHYNVPTHIFRLAGIYGPGRSAIDSIRSGIARRIDKPGHAFSRIHVDDIANILLASISQPKAGEIYNLCDDVPAPSHEVILYACELLGVEPPPLIPYDKVDLAPITQSFYADNKRVRNDKIKNDLGVRLKYESYHEGLKACLEASSDNVMTPFDMTNRG